MTRLSLDLVRSCSCRGVRRRSLWKRKKVFSSIRDDDAEAPERNASELLLAKTMRTNKEKAEQALKKITGQTSSI
jgi:hypothetical protein